MYYSGSVNSYTDLRTALFNACTLNGWTLTSDVLSKGAAYVQVTVSSATSGVPGPGVIIRGGTGYSAGALVNPSPQRPRLGRPNYNTPNISFPFEYRIFIFNNPDEVFLVVRTDVDKYLFLSFGVSNVPGVAGTGLWLAASFPAGASGSYTAPDRVINITPDDGGSSNVPSGGFFWNSGGFNDVDYVADTIHANIDSIIWANPASAGNPTAPGKFSAVVAQVPMIKYSPSAWNGSAPLIRIRGIFARASSKASMVVDVVNARYVRIDNFEPGQIFTLGSDKWMIFPFYRKDTTARNGGTSVNSSGTMGWAIRYDGS